MISLVLPVGVFPFLVRACLHNISETANMHEIDLVVVINPNEERIKQELSRYNIPHRLVIMPKNVGTIHMKMLDYCVRHADLSEWFIVQHADVLWTKKGWLKEIQDTIAAKRHNHLAFAPGTGDIFQYKNGDQIITLHDFIGVYHKPTLIKEDLSFMWGKASELKWWYPTKRAILNGDVNWSPYCGHREQRNFDMNCFVDGSELITLEYAVRHPGKTAFIERINEYYRHIQQIFRKSCEIRIKNGYLWIDNRSQPYDTANDYYHYAYYSYFCSECFQVEDFEHSNLNPLPWSCLEIFGDFCMFNAVKVRNNVFKELDGLYRKYKDPLYQRPNYDHIKGVIVNHEPISIKNQYPF